MYPESKPVFEAIRRATKLDFRHPSRTVRLKANKSDSSANIPHSHSSQIGSWLYVKGGGGGRVRDCRYADQTNLTKGTLCVSRPKNVI